MAEQPPPNFVELSKASTSLDECVNVIGLVTDFLPASRSKGTDWVCTFSIADPFYGNLEMRGGDGLRVRFFRKAEKDIPAITGIGDVIILRNLKVTHFNGGILAMARGASSWAVFEASSILDQKESLSSVLGYTKQAYGPRPTPPEIAYVVSLCNSFDTGYFRKILPRVANADPKTSNSSKTTQICRRREKFSLVKDIQVDMFYDMVGQVVKSYPWDDRVDLYITDFTPNQLLFYYELPNDNNPNEGPEGDEYNYLPKSSKTGQKWPGPFGRLTLAVTLWPPHSYFVQQQVKEGNFVFLRNVHVRVKDSKMVGSLHGDRNTPDQINISVLTDFHGDDRVKDVLRRKKDYNKKMNIVDDDDDNKQDSKEQPNELIKENVAKPNSKGQKRKRTREKRRALVDKENSSKEPNRKKRRTDDLLDELKRNTYNHSAVPGSDLNPNVRCANPLTPITPLSSILSLDNHKNTSPGGTTYTLPFQNIKTRTVVRVVDFFPPNLADFCIPLRRKSGSATESDNSDCDNSSTVSSEEEDVGATGGGQRWEWRFGLILSDALRPQKPGTDPATLTAYVSGPDAEYLLKLDAEDLHRSPNALAALREKLFLLWGDLEERRTNERPGQRKAMKNMQRQKSHQGGGPLVEISGNKVSSSREGSGGGAPESDNQGRPFQCCLKEYGVRVECEKSTEEGALQYTLDNESNQQSTFWRWERRWRMFGCTIV